MPYLRRLDLIFVKNNQMDKEEYKNLASKRKRKGSQKTLFARAPEDRSTWLRGRFVQEQRLRSAVQFGNPGVTGSWRWIINNQQQCDWSGVDLRAESGHTQLG